MLLVLLTQVLGFLWMLGIAQLRAHEAKNLIQVAAHLQGAAYFGAGHDMGGEIVSSGADLFIGPLVVMLVAAPSALGLETVIGARLVIVGFYCALSLGTWMLGRRIGGHWFGLVALGGVLLLSFAVPVFSGFGAADISGVIPAAAFLVWALYNLKRWPWSSGILVGLAVQSQVLAALAIPIMLTVILATPYGQKVSSRALRGVIFVLSVIVPILAVEVVNLVRFGAAVYGPNVQAAWWRTIEPGYVEPLATVAAIGLFALGPLLVVYMLRESVRIWRRRRWPGRVLVLLVAAGLVASTALVVVPMTLESLEHETLPDQRVAAAAIATAGITDVRGEAGPAVSVAFLAGAQFRADEDADGSIPLLIANPVRTELDQATFNAIISNECERVVVRAENYVVCVSGQ